MQSIVVCNSSLSSSLLKQNRAALFTPNFFTHNRFDARSSSTTNVVVFSSSSFPSSLRRQWNPPLAPILSQPKIDRFQVVRAMETAAEHDNRRIFINTLLLVLLQWVFRITESIVNYMKRVIVAVNPVSFYKQKLASRALRRELIIKNKFEEWVLESGQDKSIVNEFEEWMLKHRRVYKDADEKQKRYLIFKEKFQYIEAFNNGEDLGYTLGLNNNSDLTDEEYPHNEVRMAYRTIEEYQAAEECNKSRTFTNNLGFVLMQWLVRITDSIANCVAVVVSPVSLLSFFKQKLASRALQRELMMKNKFEEWVLESGEDKLIVNQFGKLMLEHGCVYKYANEKQKRSKEELQSIDANLNNGEDLGFSVGLNKFVLERPQSYK
ncbi:hypothetical protein OROGR_001834 [Orobanche gracilis]